VSASADGRKAGREMANGNTPSGGNDKKGITALVNSLVKPSHKIHAGTVQNMRFGRDFFTNDQPNSKSFWILTSKKRRPGHDYGYQSW
jgi:pyruvate-formate lyase